MKRNSRFISILAVILCVISVAAPLSAYGISGPDLVEAEESLSSAVSDHIRYITDFTAEPMEIQTLDAATGETGLKTVIGSAFIPLAPGELVSFLWGGGTGNLQNGEYYIYFYDAEKKEVWDVLDWRDVKTEERNRISVQELRKLNGFQFSDLKTARYIRVAAANGYACELLIWDGEKCGYPASALSSVFNQKLEITKLPEDASVSIQVPRTAHFLVSKPGYTLTAVVASTYNKSTRGRNEQLLFPAQVIDLTAYNADDCPKNISVVKDYDYVTETPSGDMPNGDLSDYMVIIDDLDYRADDTCETVSDTITENIQACFDFVWEAKETVGPFKKGVSYRGIPYRNVWSTANFVGWHVSKQTFMNAANDPDSIFYNNPDGTAPYYSLVCSSYATLMCGFDYPTQNYGLMHDPHNTVRIIDEPEKGALMTNGSGHCYIPIEIYHNPEGNTIYTLAEQISPLTAIRSVYEDVSDDWKGIGVKSSYADNFIYSVTHDTSSPPPYNITDYVIKNGSARPFRGDQSVYTSEMDVLINIKDAEATRLYYQKFHARCEFGEIIALQAAESPQYIEIMPGTEQITLRSATVSGNYSGADLENGAIYGIWASKDNKQAQAPSNTEFFEWYDLDEELVRYTVSDGVLVSDDPFWYVKVRSYNDGLSPGKSQGTYMIPGLNQNGEKPDYAQEEKITSVSAFFRKGQLGAYVTAKKLTEEQK